MTPQQRADDYLNAWRVLRTKGIPARLRLPIIDVLAEIERTKLGATRHENRAGKAARLPGVHDAAPQDNAPQR